MRIAFSTIYGELYTKDKLFDNNSCNIGENLLMPNILLKEKLELLGHEVHTVDVMSEFDKIVFLDLPTDSWLTSEGIIEKLKYLLKAKWKRDYLLRAVKKLPREQIILQINEPPSVRPKSYVRKYHEFFGTVLTWNDDYVNNRKYKKFFIPQYWNGKMLRTPYSEKKDFVMICGNKTSNHKNELYTQRREIIDYFEDKTGFDLYGFGWSGLGLRNYKGTVAKKLETLSGYKFCFCYENIKNVSGYITEKIFDCFFAGCVPIYMGADNVELYIPSGCFVNANKFNSLSEVHEFLNCMPQEEYETYLFSIESFLESNEFSDTFSVESYIKTMISTMEV